MFDYWSYALKNILDSNLSLFELETFLETEQHWQDYLKNQIEYSKLGFDEYLMGPDTPLSYNTFRGTGEIKTWFKVKFTIFQ